MGHSISTGHCVDDSENNLSNVAKSHNSGKECLQSEQCAVSCFKKPANFEESCNSGFGITADENSFSTSSITQAGLHNYFTDVADVHLDFNNGIREPVGDVQNPDLCTSSDFEKPELLSENLSKMIFSFKKCEESCDKFLTVYPSWSGKRKEVIAQLKEIAEGLDKIKWDSNIAKLVGSSVGVAGGILTVAGSVLIPFTMGMSVPVMVGGMVTTGLGGATSLGTAITETCLLKKRIEAAQEIVKQDKEEFNAMAELFNHAESYMSSLEDFLGLNPVAKVHNALELCNLLPSESVAISDASCSRPVGKPFMLEDPGVRKKVMHVAKAILPTTLHNFAVPLSIGIAIAANPNLGKLFQEIKQLHHDNPVIYGLITIIYRIQILKQANMEANYVTCVNTAAKLGGVTSAVVGKSLSRTLFAGLSLAVDVVSLILTSVDFHNGSHCHSAESLRKVNEQLGSEFDIVKSVYLELHKPEMNKDI